MCQLHSEHSAYRGQLIPETPAHVVGGYVAITAQVLEHESPRDVVVVVGLAQ